MKNTSKYFVLMLIIAAGLTGCKTQDKKVSEDINFAGYIENTQVNVTTRIPGQIMEIYVHEGDTVKKGQKIAQLDARVMKAEMSALQAKLANIAVNKQRVENLYKAGALPLQKLDDIETGYAMLKDKISALKINIDDMTIRAPMDGVITVKVLEVNQMMPPGMPVVIETNPSGTWARFNIPEKYLNQIQLGKNFTLTSNIPGVTFNAKVIQVIPLANFATYTPTELRGERDIRSFDVKMKITSNENQCKPGISVFVALKPEHSKVDQ